MGSDILYPKTYIQSPPYMGLYCAEPLKVKAINLPFYKWQRKSHGLFVDLLSMLHRGAHSTLGGYRVQDSGPARKILNFGGWVGTQPRLSDPPSLT